MYKQIYDTHYEINECGDVRRLPHKLKILPQLCKRDNIMRVRLTINGKRTSFHLARLIAIHFIPNPNGYRYVTYRDGDHQNNHLLNLKWALDNKTHYNSLEDYRTKLDKDKVKQIRDSNLSYSNLSIIYNVSKTCIYSIKKRKSWKNV
jgi:hypothetical protein